MHYEVMTGVERRRRWSDEERLSVLGTAIEYFDGEPGFETVTSAFAGAFSYVKNRSAGDAKPNLKKQLSARFLRGKEKADAALAKAKLPAAVGRVITTLRFGGIQDNTVNRLLLMSSSEHHLRSVPMATLNERYPR